MEMYSIKLTWHLVFWTTTRDFRKTALAHLAIQILWGRVPVALPIATLILALNIVRIGKRCKCPKKADGKKPNEFHVFRAVKTLDPEA